MALLQQSQFLQQEEHYDLSEIRRPADLQKILPGRHLADFSPLSNLPFSEAVAFTNKLN